MVIVRPRLLILIVIKLRNLVKNPRQKNRILRMLKSRILKKRVLRLRRKKVSSLVLLRKLRNIVRESNDLRWLLGLEHSLLLRLMVVINLMPIVILPLKKAWTIAVTLMVMSRKL